MAGQGEQRTVRIRVEGLVQGVGFRFFALREARRAGIRGYVRNLPDGSVEAVASGEAGAVDEFARRLGEGPPSSRVGGVDVEEAAGAGPFEEFEIRL